MLNLNNNNKINSINALNLDKNSSSKYNDLAHTKHYPPANKEWFNNICQYNKNYIKSLPITNNVINKLFKSYFHLTSSLEKHKIKNRNMRIITKRLSANRIFLSRTEMKHTNNKVTITLYTYNRTLFCNGLTILRNKIWISKNISILKKSFFSGMLNISRKLIFSKIFTNIINPFDSLEKKVKNKHLGDRKISIFARKKNIKNMYIIQFLQNIITISKFSIIVKFIESLSLFNLNKINKFKHLSSKQGDNFNFKNKEIVLKNQFFYFSKFVYMNMINKYLNFYLYNIYRIKKYISNYKYKNRGEKIIYKNKLDNSNNNKPFNDKKIFKPELYYSKNFDFLNYINYFKPTFLYNIKNNFSPLAKANNYLNEFKFNKFIVTLHEFMGLNSKNKGLDIKFNSSNLLEDRISVLARKNKLNSLYKKLKYNVIHKFNSYVFKINKLNLKKYNFIFKFFNLENKILPSYYFKQLNKRPNFVSVKKKVQSIWNIMYLKVNSNKFVGKFKIIDSVISNTDKIQNSNINTPFNILAKQDNIFIPSNLDINTNPQLSVTVNKKSILSYQSDLFLRKKLNNFLPLYIYYIQMIYIHNYKYKNWFLLGLKNIIYNIYQKKVEFNIINLKYMHLSSDILSESMAIKLKKRKNRIFRVLKEVLKLIKISSLHSFLSTINKKKLNIENYKTLKMHFNLPNKQIDTVINSINYKKISGIRIEASGRLTKRLTASRSLFKIKYKGNLKNWNSYKGLSSPLVKGYMKPNIQYTNVNSKTRNGSFGLKTWISSS